MLREQNSFQEGLCPFQCDSGQSCFQSKVMPLSNWNFKAFGLRNTDSAVQVHGSVEHHATHTSPVRAFYLKFHKQCFLLWERRCQKSQFVFLSKTKNRSPACKRNKEPNCYFLKMAGLRPFYWLQVCFHWSRQEHALSTSRTIKRTIDLNFAKPCRQ